MSDGNRPIAGRWSARRWGMLIILVLLCTAWIGCSTKKNYKLLSFFFDGVPDPNAPPHPVGQPDAVGAVGKPTLPVLSTHKPFGDNNCTACHKGGREAGFELSAVNASICMDCHEKVLRAYPMMHAPVAARACLWCHNPHDSPSPSLLRDPAPAVCTQCHEKELLGAKPPEHLLPDAKCLDCHIGHGGVKRYQLRADLPTGTTRPTSIPAGGGAHE